MGRYLAALERELAAWAPHLRPETIFFGGGTPTLLTLRQLERLLGFLSSHAGRLRESPVSPEQFPRTPEFTFECNPATLSLDKARLLRSFGVNRISMGVQSFDERILDKLGRIHSVAQALASYDILRQAGFDNVNLDLMFALPGQTMEDWEKTLRQAIVLQPEHISTYCLTIEKDTAFWKLFEQGILVPSEDQEIEMYQRTWEILENAGYCQYEISNFARANAGRSPLDAPLSTLRARPPSTSNAPRSTTHAPRSFQCRHNIGYWRCEDCIGLGPSAASNCGTKRWRNIANTEEYIARIDRGEFPIDFEETLDEETRAGEYVAFGLRMMEGISQQEFHRRFGHDLTELWPAELETLISEGLVQWNADWLQLSSRGKMLADEVSANFVGLAEPIRIPRVNVQR